MRDLPGGVAMDEHALPRVDGRWLGYLPRVAEGRAEGRAINEEGFQAVITTLRAFVSAARAKVS